MSIYFEKSFQRSFGTFPLRGSELHAAIELALAAGYRAFDTAQMYRNESETGEALATSNVPRDELCITTKVEPENFTADRFINSVEESVRNLRVDFVDVLLLHWPAKSGNAEPLGLLMEARARGLCRHIGISNFTAAMMREAKTLVDVPLVTNQVEFHPLLNQDILLDAATETGIPLSAYCTVARGAVFKEPLFEEIGREYNKSAGQVVLRWILQKGVATNTMSTKAANIRDNFDVMDFTLSSIDMARIDACRRANKRIVTAELVPSAPNWD